MRSTLGRQVFTRTATFDGARKTAKQLIEENYDVDKRDEMRETVKDLHNQLDLITEKVLATKAFTLGMDDRSCTWSKGQLRCDQGGLNARSLGTNKR